MLTAAVLITAPIAAQTPPSPAAELLARASSLSCAFRVMALAGWNRDEPHAVIREATLSIPFSEINADEGTAASAGSFGRADLIARLTPRTLHLIESLRDGRIYVTTVFARLSANGRLKAVHSRHELTDFVVAGFTSTPEQYYGECDVTASNIP